MTWKQWLPALAGYAAALVVLLWMMPDPLRRVHVMVFTLAYAAGWLLLSWLRRRTRSVPR